MCVCVCCFHLTLGGGGHSQGDGDLEVVDGSTDPGPSVDGVVEVSDVDGPHGHADEGDDLGEHTHTHTPLEHTHTHTH